MKCKGCEKHITSKEGYLCQQCPCWVCFDCAIGIVDVRACVSHYSQVDLKLKGDIEPILRALCDIRTARNKNWTRDMLKVHKDPQNLKGYMGKTRKQKAHIVIPKKYVQNSANDIGFERKKDGTWTLHVSDYDKGYYNAKWQKEFMSKWAFHSTTYTAEQQGHSWTVRTDKAKKKQYVTVTVARQWGGNYGG